jgi:hypothetical protein
VVFVMAAGNDGRLTVPYPAALSVSAIADFDGKPGGLADPTCRSDEDDTRLGGPLLFANADALGGDGTCGDGQGGGDDGGGDDGGGDDGGGGEDGGSDDGDAAPIALEAVGSKVRGLQQVDLSWQGATSTTVDILRDGDVIDTADDTGSYTDHLDARGGGTYAYQVCEDGMERCSAVATVSF